MNIGPLLVVLPLLGVELQAPVLAVAHLDPVSGTRHRLSHGQSLATHTLLSRSRMCLVKLRIIKMRDEKLLIVAVTERGDSKILSCGM